MNDDLKKYLEESGLDPKIERVKSAGTLVIVAIVNVLNVYGYAADAGPWLNLFGSILAAASIVYAWWKNQNISLEAVAGQGVLNMLKSGKHEK